MKTYLTHAQVVLFNEVLDDAALLLEDGIIRAINPLWIEGKQSYQSMLPNGLS